MQPDPPHQQVTMPCSKARSNNPATQQQGAICNYRLALCLAAAQQGSFCEVGFQEIRLQGLSLSSAAVSVRFSAYRVAKLKYTRISTGV